MGSILSDIRAQYDDVRYESERKEKELNRVRNLIRQADSANGNKQDEARRGGRAELQSTEHAGGAVATPSH